MSTPTTHTNGEAIRAGFVPCETSPVYGGLSRTVHPFHGVAEVTVGSRGERRHVCRDCAHKQPQAPAAGRGCPVGVKVKVTAAAERRAT
jgi:hypothetical protein